MVIVAVLGEGTSTYAQAEAQTPGSIYDSEAMTNSTGPCLVVDHKEDVVIEIRSFGPCSGDGVLITNSKDVILRNLTISNTSGNGIEVQSSTGVHIVGNKITHTSSSVYVLGSSSVEVLRNQFFDVQGPMPRGQFVQFNNVSGEGNRIISNYGKNTPGASRPEDAISMFKSSGRPGSPIVIENNVIEGGGPSASGGGIMAGDFGGHDIEIRRNRLIDPGQYGIGVSGGNNITVEDNQVLGREQSFTNVGIYVWAQSGQACSNITVRNNYVRWTNKKDKPNPWWDGGNCGPVKEPTNNDFGGYVSSDSVSK